MSDAISLPRWQSHKIVQADKIIRIDRVDGPDGSDVTERWYLACGVVIEAKGSLRSRVGAADSALGGYYVRYVDGFESWSPADAFEDGYTAASTVESASDDRVVNNVLRHEYRVLTDAEKQRMRAIKDHGLAFLELLHDCGGTDPAGDRLGSRQLSLAGTKIEEAVMWAVKHVTG